MCCSIPDTWEEWCGASGFANPEWNPDWCRKAAMAALRQSRLDILDKIFEEGMPTPSVIYDVLCEALRLERRDMVPIILARDTTPPYLLGIVASLAAWYSHQELSRCLAEDGITVSEESDEDMLRWFAKDNHPDFFVAAAHSHWSDQTIRDVLMNSVEHENDAMLRWGIFHAGDKIGSLGGDALLWACDQGCVFFVEKLLVAGVNVDFEEYGSCSRPVHAAAGKYPDIVEILLEQGANPAGSDDCNYGSALFQSACRGCLRSVQLLLQYGCPVDDEAEGRGAPLVAALENNHLDIAEYLLNRGAWINRPIPISEDIPLVHFALNGNMAVVQFLLDHGASPSVLNRDEEAHAVIKQHAPAEIVEFLAGMSRPTVIC